jgi:hypothetical protein
LAFNLKAIKNLFACIKMKKDFSKKASVITLEEFVFFLLNIIFIIMLVAFVFVTGQRYFIYEETYSKQIAILIDNAKPDMSILLNVKDAVDIAKKQNKPLDQIFKINEKTRKVQVSLGQGGYAYSYFSNYSVDLRLDNDILTINIRRG